MKFLWKFFRQLVALVVVLSGITAWIYSGIVLIQYEFGALSALIGKVWTILFMVILSPLAAGVLPILAAINGEWWVFGYLVAGIAGAGVTWLGVTWLASVNRT